MAVWRISQAPGAICPSVFRSNTSSGLRAKERVLAFPFAS